MFDQQALEQALSTLPLYQYLWLNPHELVFSERVRAICRNECPMYGKSWSCPPAVGTVEQCRARCLDFPQALLLCTVSEVDDVSDLQQTLATRAPHEQLTQQVAGLLRGQTKRMLVLSSQACERCEHCTYPDAPCKAPQDMYPCVESHGILATELSGRCGLDFFNGDIVSWFSLIFFEP